MKTGIEQKNCSGCTVCKVVCPVKCVSMKEDSFGFMQPTFSSACINCGLCAKTCPMNLDNSAKIDFRRPINAYSAVSKDLECVKNSSSGGAFTEIAKLFAKGGNYVIFGARYADNFDVVIDYIEDVAEIEKFQKSKYVQSLVSDSYSKAKKFLDEGKRVLFSGTPCQISALKLYLRKDYENLLTLDFSCHGYGSPKVFKQYLKDYEKKYNSKVIAYSFREKSKSLWRYHSQSSKITFENGKEKINFMDTLFRGFTRGLFKCTACYNCQYARLERVSDISMCDFWSIGNIDPTLNVMKGVSLLLSNTPKGENIMCGLNQTMHIKVRNLIDAVYGNDPLNHSAKPNAQRDKFFEAIKRENVADVIDKFAPQASILKRGIMKLKSIIGL